MTRRSARSRPADTRIAGRPATSSSALALRALVMSIAVAGALPGGVATPSEAETISIPVTRPAQATLSGDLQLPSGPGRHPAVILLHGCGGANPSVAGWAHWLRGEGYATLELDSFGGRNLRTVCNDGRALTMTSRVGDVHAAAAELMKVSAVDPDRIAVLGFSHGGGTAIIASGASAGRPDARIRAFVALWPGCGSGMPIGPAPVLMLLGGKDDWTPPEACRAVGDAARAAGQPVTVVVYPDAGHGFGYAHLKDVRGPTPGRAFVPGARGGRGATIEYNASAHADAEKRVRAFLAEHLGK